MKKQRCYIYTRVSTAMQVDGFSLDAQKEKLKKYADYQDRVVVREFSDEGKSGKNVDGRPQFKEMLELIEAGTDDIDYVDLDVSGVMILQDSISLEDIEYPFSLKIEGDLKEFITNLENSLDIIELLWENIVLEIPLKYTKVEDLSKFHGDGWKLVSEEEATTSHNPFNELLKNIEEE